MPQWSYFQDGVLLVQSMHYVYMHRAWEERAVGVLNECYQKDKVMAHSLLTRQLKTWGGTTLFIIADSSICMDFMGHSCCQTKLNRIWRGRMALYTSMWKVEILLLSFHTVTYWHVFSDVKKSWWRRYCDGYSGFMRWVGNGKRHQDKPA